MHAATRRINRRAFGQDQEGDIVDALRANGAPPELSLVGERRRSARRSHRVQSRSVVGNLNGCRRSGRWRWLPQYQRRGIGSRLVEAGNQLIAEAGYPFIVVVGHPDFYPRFGFQPART